MRLNFINKHDIICLTVPGHPLPYPRDHLDQPKQIVHSEIRAARRELDKRIEGREVRETRRERAQAPVRIVVVDAVLTPRLAPRHQFEFLTEGRVIRMGNAEPLRATVRLEWS